MMIGPREIKWLTSEDAEVFDSFCKLASLGGYITKDDKKNRLYTIGWLANACAMNVIMVVTAVHYSSQYDLLANIIHHGVGIFDDCLVVYVAWVNRHVLLSILDDMKLTYDYDSELVEGFSKKITRERLTFLKTLKSVIALVAGGIMLEVQVFYVLEVAYFQTYKTMFPFYIGIDLDHPFVYTVVVIWQESVYFLTTTMVLAVSSIGFTAWSHLTLEIEILKFVISHLKEISQECLDKQGHIAGRDKESLATIYKIYCDHVAKHHGAIIRYFKGFRDSMSYITIMVFVTGFCLFVGCGISALSENMGIKLKLAGLFVVQVFVIYGWCWVGQSITDLSDEISDTIMATPWWLMPKTCQSTLLLIMTGCSRKLVLTTPFGQIANRECCMDMMKASYQAVNILFHIMVSLK